jgi:hypothetical protein
MGRETNYTEWFLVCIEDWVYNMFLIYWLHSDRLCMQEFHKTRYFIVSHNFVKNLLILPQNDKNNEQIINSVSVNSGSVKSPHFLQPFLERCA